jgi:hypothetical protein
LYRLRIPVAVEVSSDEGVVAAHAIDLEVYGAGGSEYEALADLRRIIVEELEDLVEAEKMLGPGLASRLRRFRELVEQTK